MPIKCVIPGPQVKTLARAINTLSKIGEELHIEFVADELILRTVSPSKAAYGSFTFRQDFFVDFRNDAVTKNKQICRFRFHMKSLLPIFKSVNNAEHQIETCEIEADIAKSRMHFSFIRKYRVVQKYSITMMETSFLETTYTRKNTKSHVTASARLLAEIICHFPKKVVEITLAFDDQQFCATNYTGDLPDPTQASQMQLIMDMNEFDSYEIDHATCLICTIRELRGIMSFIANFTYSSDIIGLAGLPVNLYFSDPGVPLLVCIESPNQYEGNFVIATIEPLSEINSHAQQHLLNKPPSQAQIPSRKGQNNQPCASRIVQNPSRSQFQQQDARSTNNHNDLPASNLPASNLSASNMSASNNALPSVRPFSKAAASVSSNHNTPFQSSMFAAEPSQTVAKEFLVADTDDEEEGNGSDREV